MKTKIKYFIILALCILASSCGFRPRSAADIPEPLHILYLDASNPYSSLNIELVHMLRGLDVQLVPAEHAKLHLHIDNIVYTHDYPAITTSSIAVTFTYRLNILLSITDDKGNMIIGPHPISANTQSILNTNQILMPGIDVLAKPQLNHQIVALIFYWLASDQVRNRIEDWALKHKH